MDPQAALDAIIQKIQEFLERNGTSLVVDRRAVQAAVTELTKNEDDLRDEAMQVISAFKQPKYTFNPARKTYHLDENPRPLHADASAKVALFRERFELVHQRLRRNDLFTPPVLGASKPEYVELTPIESLPGVRGTAATVLGLVIQPEEGDFALEDLQRSIRADFSHAETTAGLFTEGSIVLAQGVLQDDDVFRVDMMGFPPAEPRVQSLVAMGSVDPFQVIRTPAEWSAAHALERAASDVMFVVASDIHLDQPDVMAQLETMFRGFTQCGVVPDMFILCGPFMLSPFGSHRDDRRTFVRLMDSLADLIARFPSIASTSRFVLVPGPNDPGSAGVLPQPPLPRSFCKSLEDRVANVTLASNPCRIRFHTQEIVIFRENLLSRMRRCCVVPPRTEETVDLTEHLARTVVDQSHLCPLPLVRQPVYWAHDVGLRLFPVPDVIILADDTEQYHWSYEDTTIFNPGSFPAEGRGLFTAYRPATQAAEMSEVKG